MPTMNISASWSVDDDQRANATVMHGLGEEIEALEAKIASLTGTKVRVEIGVRRTKKPSPAAGLRVAAE